MDCELCAGVSLMNVASLKYHSKITVPFQTCVFFSFADNKKAINRAQLAYIMVVAFELFLFYRILHALSCHTLIHMCHGVYSKTKAMMVPTITITASVRGPAD